MVERRPSTPPPRPEPKQRRHRKPPVLPPAVLQPRSFTAAELAISEQSVAALERAGAFRSVKLNGRPTGKAFNIISEVHDYIARLTNDEVRHG
jgi:hypothetical protein